MATTTNQANKFAKRWNDKAYELKCSARIWFKGKTQQHFMWRNTFQNKHEIWFPVTAKEFATLTANFPILETI